MNLQELIFNTNTLVGIGAVVFAIAYVVNNFILGKSKVDEKAARLEEKSLSAAQALAESYEKQLRIEREERAGLQEQLNRLRQDLGKLEGINAQLQRQVEEYMKLIGPSGELMTTLKSLQESIHVAPVAMQFMEDVRAGKLVITPSPSVTVKETTVK